MALASHGELYIPGTSLVHRWAVRPKLLSLLGLMFAIALVRHLVLVPWALGSVALLYGLAGLPLGYLWRRLPYPGLFIVAMVGILPWISGETILWQWGALGLRLEGMQTAALVAGRFLAILITGFVLLGTTPFLDLLKALRSLGLPQLLTDMTLLTYRYLYDIAGQLATMQQAMRLRGYGFTRQSLGQRWRWLGALFGSLLLRSYGRSQRIYKAMRLRGYGQPVGRSQVAPAMPVSASTLGMTGVTGAVAVGFVLCEWMVSRL